MTSTAQFSTRRAGRALARAAGIALLAIAATPAAGDDAVPARPTSIETISDIDAAMRHIEAFQRIADASGGDRGAGGEGDVASRDYVVERLEAAGYAVERQRVEFDRFASLGPATLRLTAPDAVALVEGEDFAVMTYSGAGAVEADVVPVDLSLGAPGASTSGCDPEDFEGFPPGRIALLQRGGCLFADKTANARAAGAVAAIIFNQGDAARRTGLFRGSLGPDAWSEAGGGAFPVLALRDDVGARLAATQGLKASLSAETEIRPVSTENILAERPAGERAPTPGASDETAGRVALAGAHLDSVYEGPGVNDNASGSAALLAIAEALARSPEPSTLRFRFAWWGAEELGLIGARRYVRALGDELQRIAFYINLDMLGSINGGRFLMDGDGSEGVAGRRRLQSLDARAVAAEIETAYAAFFDAAGLAHRVEPMAFASDYAPFYAADIPVGGVYSGAGRRMTEEEVALFGGVVGAPRDPCYHTACDTLENLDADRLRDLMMASEYVLRVFARRAAAAGEDATDDAPTRGGAPAYGEDG